MTDKIKKGLSRVKVEGEEGKPPVPREDDPRWKEIDRQARVIAQPYVAEERERCAQIVLDMSKEYEAQIGRPGVKIGMIDRKMLMADILRKAAGKIRGEP